MKISRFKLARLLLAALIVDARCAIEAGLRDLADNLRELADRDPGRRP